MKEVSSRFKLNNLCKTKDVKENDDRQDKSGQFIQRFPGQVGIIGNIFTFPCSNLLFHIISMYKYMGKTLDIGY